VGSSVRSSVIILFIYLIKKIPNVNKYERHDLPHLHDTHMLLLFNHTVITHSAMIVSINGTIKHYQHRLALFDENHLIFQYVLDKGEAVQFVLDNTPRAQTVEKPRGGNRIITAHHLEPVHDWMISSVW
jgi:hypothetical protein